MPFGNFYMQGSEIWPGIVLGLVFDSGFFFFGGGGLILAPIQSSPSLESRILLNPPLPDLVPHYSNKVESFSPGGHFLIRG